MSLATMTSSSASDAQQQMQQYSEWQAWASGERHISESDLLSEFVDPAEERHMYVPMKQASFSSRFPLNENLGGDEMVARVVAFFQAVQTNNAIRQLQRDEQDYSFQFLPGPAIADAPMLARLPQHPQADATDIEDPNVNLTELGESPSFLAEQAAIWERLKNPSKNDKSTASVVPIIPEWLHEAVHQEGRRIRVVAVDKTTETRAVTCIGCRKKMVAATNVQLVFCPGCGTTFSPDNKFS